MPRAANTSPQTLLVLALLLESPRSWHYGYGISQRTSLRSGTLYPILSRLEEMGWLDTKWTASEQPGRPPRHTYRLTSEGAKAARQHLTATVSTGKRLTLHPAGGKFR